MIKAILLGVAVGCDAFGCALGYGARKMKFPLPCRIIIALFGSAFLGLALVISSFVERFLPPSISSAVIGTVLIFLGVSSILLSAIKIRLKDRSKIFVNDVFGITLRIGVSVSPQEPHELASLKESIALGFALSLDSLASGLAAGMTLEPIEMLACTLLAFAAGLSLLFAGVKLGARIASKTSLDLSYMSGIVLLILGLITVAEG